MWLTWLTDEESIATTSEALLAHLQLYKDSTEDCPSVSMWNRRLEFENTLVEKGILRQETFDKSMEDALVLAGHFLPDSRLLWSSCRRFLSARDDRSLVARSYVRQLSIPMNASEDVLQEFEKWADRNEADSVVSARLAHSRAIRMRYAREEREQKIAAVLKENNRGPELESLWIDYINFECNRGADFETDKTSLNVAIGVCARAVASIPQSLALWQKYVTLLDVNHCDAAHRLLAYRRGVRNIRYDGLLQAGLLQASERVNGAEETDRATEKSSELEMYRVALSSALEWGLRTSEDYLKVITSYCGVIRRRGTVEDFRGSLKFSLDTISRLFPTWTIGKLYLHRFHARVECEMEGGSIENIRNAWEAVVKDTSHAAMWTCWNNYIVMEKRWKCYDHCRGLFKRAIASVKDYPYMVVSEWENFENEVGTLETMDAACKIIVPFKQKVVRENTANSTAASSEQKKQKRPANASKKRKMQQKPNRDSAAKVQKVVAESVPSSSSPELFTLYVCNLSQAVTASQFECIFKDLEGFVSARLVVHKDGMCKGFGYADFKDRESAGAGLTDELKHIGSLYLVCAQQHA
eukprot:g2402.t1